MATQILGFLNEVMEKEGHEQTETDRPIVLVRSDNEQFNLAIMELQQPQVRQEAIKYAGQRGTINARCEMPSAPYPVTVNGEHIADPRKQVTDHYRIEIPISTGL